MKFQINRFHIMKIVFVIILIIIALIVFNNNYGINRMIINRPGEYRVERGKYNIAIDITEHGIVKYNLINIEDHAIEIAGDAGSSYSRWYIQWSAKKDLWVYSGDIGISVWRQSINGKYEQQSLTVTEPNSILNDMPFEFKKRLPDSLKAIFK